MDMSYSLHKLVMDLIELEEESWPDVLVQIEGEYYLVRPGAEVRQVKGDDFVVIPALRWIRGEGDPSTSTVAPEDSTG